MRVFDCHLSNVIILFVILFYDKRNSMVLSFSGTSDFIANTDMHDKSLQLHVYVCLSFDKHSYLQTVHRTEEQIYAEYLSRVVRKPAFCICENKGADQLRGNLEADQRLCFHYIDSAIPLLSKYEISSL